MEYEIFKVLSNGDGTSSTLELVGRCKNLEKSFEWIRRKCHTMLEYNGFKNPSHEDSRALKYTIREAPVNYLD